MIRVGRFHKLTDDELSALNERMADLEAQVTTLTGECTFVGSCLNCGWDAVGSHLCERCGMTRAQAAEAKLKALEPLAQLANEAVESMEFLREFSISKSEAWRARDWLIKHDALSQERTTDG